jgi:hypothetical protein
MQAGRKILALAALFGVAACSDAPLGLDRTQGGPLMAITQIGAPVTNSTGGLGASGLGLTAPAVVNNDLLIAQVVVRSPTGGGSPTQVCADGWTEIDRATQGTNTLQVILVRVYDAPAAEATHNFQFKAGSCGGANETKQASGGLIRYSGVDVDAEPSFFVKGTAGNGGGGTPTAPSVASVAAGSLVLRFFGSLSGAEITPTTDRVYSVSSTAGGDRSAAAYAKTQAADGATGTATASAGSNWVAQTVVLKMLADEGTTETYLDDVSGSGVYAGNATLTATLLDDDDNALSGKTVKFYVDEVYVGSADTDANGVAEYTWNAHVLDAGDYDMEAIFDGDGSYDASSEEGTLTIDKASTTVTYNGQSPDPVQYSDEVTLSASVSPAIAGSIEFFVGVTSVGSQAVNGSGDASVTFIADYAPGKYDVEVVFTPTDDANYYGDNDEVVDGFEVSKEDARAVYTGVLFASTKNVTSSDFTVQLSATVVDTADAHRGDIRNARVTFKRDGNPITVCTDLVPQLVDPADLTIGTVGCEWSSSIGNLASLTYGISVAVSGHYTGSDQASLTVSKGEQNSIAGGGYFINSGSAGQYAADDGLRTNFGFNVKFNAAGRRLQGQVNVIIRTATHTYQIKSNAIDNLTADVDAGTAVFQSKANLTDITDPDNPEDLGGNRNIQMVIEDGNPDRISITLRAANGQLLYSSSWNGVQTVHTDLAGGNLQIR